MPMPRPGGPKKNLKAPQQPQTNIVYWGGGGEGPDNIQNGGKLSLLPGWATATSQGRTPEATLTCGRPAPNRPLVSH